MSRTAVDVENKRLPSEEFAERDAVFGDGLLTDLLGAEAASPYHQRQSTVETPLSMAAPTALHDRGWTVFFSLLMVLGGVLGLVGFARLSGDDGPSTKPIKQIHAAEVVWVASVGGEQDTQFGMDVDPPTWRLLMLKAPKGDGAWADIELLRPMWWLEQKQVRAGGTVDISVPECGIDGRAEVLSVLACPEIGEVPDGYRVVTGRFVHHGARVVDLHVEGLEEPISTTPNHPFWSHDRQRFVRADELKPGERLNAACKDTSGRYPRVIAVKKRPGRHTVYNLEVQFAHVYHVGANGLLVHNGTEDLCEAALRRLHSGLGTAPVRIPGKLSREASDALRGEARDIWQATTGTPAIWDELQVHHRIPLEWSHQFGKADPNRLSNLVGIDGTAHTQVTNAWATWKRGLNGRTPTQTEIMQQALRIDEMFSGSWVFPK